MSHEALSPQQFGFKPHPEDAEYPGLPEAVPVRKKISTDPSRYTTNQRSLDPAALEHYTKKGLSRNQWGSSNAQTPIRVVKHEDVEQLWGGHHRLIAAHRRGQRSVTAEYVDLDQ